MTAGAQGTRRAWRVMSALALVLASASMLLSVFLFTLVRREGSERRDQSCRIAERKQRADVERLHRTYAYLLRELRAGRTDTPLNIEVLRGLGQAEAEAREDDAPPFCDEPGVGLPEPDPVVPDRPLVLL
jgi:hypothetical protein